jgi:uncharacterized membrane protein
MMGPAFLGVGRSRDRRFSRLLPALALLELLADKVPGIPDRTAAGPLVGRAVAGAAVVLALRPRSGVGSAVGATVVGALAAIAGAHAGLRLRRLLTKSLGGRAWSGAVAGLIEDALLLAAGRRLMAAVRQSD